MQEASTRWGSLMEMMVERVGSRVMIRRSGSACSSLRTAWGSMIAKMEGYIARVSG
jgi:hypothetical protein